MPAKVVFIGLDSADPELLQRWGQEGKLPNIRKLQQASAWGAPLSPPGLGSGAMWPSLCTGVTPAVHGRYFFQQVWRGSYDSHKFEGADLHFDPFWETLSRRGLKVAVIDVPKAPLARELNGVQLVDWMVHSPAYEEPCSVPAELIDEVHAVYGRDPIGDCDGSHRGIEDFRKLKDGLLQKVEAKTRLSADYLAREDWDVFITVYGETHCVAHQFWHAHDPAMADYDPSLAAAIGDPVLQVYQEIDAGVGRIVEAAGRNAMVMLFAGPGMGPNFSGNYLVEEILQRFEHGPVRVAAGGLELLRRVWRRLPLKLRKKFRHAGSGAGDGLIAQLRSRRKCFTVPHNDLAAAIRINVIGREPHGLVKPGAEYDAFCAELTRELMAIKNEETGRPIVREVMRMRDIYQGPFVEDLPDLLVHWSREAPIRTVSSPRIGVVRGPRPHRTGDHHAECVFYASGPGIRAGGINHPFSVMDFPPTVAELLGVRLEGLNGEPIPELVPGGGLQTQDAGRPAADPRLSNALAD
ncbi:MAG TPA: alkaline phosphatase family protein [Alphaproteobacteria bacterium]